MNNLMTKLGGRKFLMALVVIGAAMFLEMKSEKGLSPTMASFLGGIVAAFSAANYMATAKHMMSKNPEPQQPAMGPQELNALVSALGQLGKELQDIKDISSNTGKLMVGLSNRGGNR